MTDIGGKRHLRSSHPEASESKQEVGGDESMGGRVMGGVSGPVWRDSFCLVGWLQASFCSAVSVDESYVVFKHGLLKI